MSTVILRRTVPAVLFGLASLTVACSTLDDDIETVQRAAVQGDAEAQYSLGLAYKNDEGVGRDDAEAARWWLQAAEQGHADAQYRLGLAYRDGEGVDRDHTEAAQLWLQAAEQGHAYAQYWLGEAHRKGEGVLQDVTEAARWFRMAAEQGNGSAQSSLAWAYLTGEGVVEDNAEAGRWFQMAAEQGSVTIEFYVAHVQEDAAEAARLFRMGAEQGHAGSQYNLGWRYMHGDGVPQDTVPRHYTGGSKPPNWGMPAHSTISAWATGSARVFPRTRRKPCAGSAWLLNRATPRHRPPPLGGAYALGEGTLKDLRLAHMWYNIASANGHESAGGVRDRLERDMTATEIRRATDLARACMEADYRDCDS